MSDNLYFEPPSRLQLVDKLAHLLRFSNVFMMLAGPVGAGVSTVVKQLHQQVAESDVFILSLEIKGVTSHDKLLQILNNAIDEVFPNNEEHDEEIGVDLLSAFQQKIDTLATLKRKILLSIDNADFLGDEALQSLLNLIQASQNEISIMLAGSTDIVTRVSDQVVDPSLSDIVHHEILNPFSRLETEEFIQLSFVRGGDFSAKQLTDIFLKSQGYPGLILQLTNEMIKSGKIILNGKNTILPVPHIIGIAVILTAIITVSSWQYFSDESLLEEGKQSSQSLDLAVVTVEPEEIQQTIVSELEQHTDRAQELQQEIRNLAGQIEAQELLIETVRTESKQEFIEDALPVAATASIEPVTVLDQPDKVEVELADQAQQRTSEIVLEGVKDEVAIAQEQTNRELADISKTAVTPLVKPAIKPVKVDVEKAQEPLEAVNAAKEQNEAAIEIAAVKVAVEQPKVIKDVVKEVVKDAVSTEVIAKVKEKTIEQSFSELTRVLKQNISSESLAVVQSREVQSVVVQESSINAAVVPDKAVRSVKLAGVDTGAQLAKIEKQVAVDKPLGFANAELNVQVLKSWPINGFTLQLLGTRSQAGIAGFLKNMPNSEKMRHFKATLKGKPWYVVVYGQYPTRASANAAKSALPAKLKALKPWIKSIKSISNAIKK